MIKIWQMQSTRWTWKVIDDGTGKTIRGGDKTFQTQAECLSHVDRFVKPGLEVSEEMQFETLHDLKERGIATVMSPEAVGADGKLPQ